MSGVRVNLRNEFIPLALIEGLFITLVMLNVTQANLLLDLLRAALGLFCIIFIPGYTLQAALFPYKEQLDGIERLAVSLGLGFTIIPPVAFSLDRLPWGLDLWPILIAECGVSVLFAAIALYRRSRIPITERFWPSFELELTRDWLHEQNRSLRISAYILVGAFMVIILAIVAMLTLRQPGEEFTEFYVLGADNLAQDYPRDVWLNEEVEVTIGIVNHQGKPADYHLAIYNNNTLIAQGPDITLQDNEAVETPVRFSPVEIGENVPIEFRLFIDDDATPCCTLRLWLSVRPAREAR